MDNNTLNKLSLLVSVIWLVFLFARILMMSRIDLEPEQAELFTNVLNILLIGFIVIFGGLLLMRFGRFSAAKTLKSTHCQQCYAKMSKGQEFCPKCGWSRDPNYNKGKYRFLTSASTYSDQVLSTSILYSALCSLTPVKRL